MVLSNSTVIMRPNGDDIVDGEGPQCSETVILSILIGM